MTKWSIFWESKSNFVLINALIDSEPQSVQEGGNYDGQLGWLLDKPRVRQVTWEEKPTSLRGLPPPTGQRWLVGWVSRGGGGLGCPGGGGTGLLQCVGCGLSAGWCRPRGPKDGEGSVVGRIGVRLGHQEGLLP